MTIEQLTAAQAIEASAREDRIVHVEGDGQMHADLLADCEDSTVARVDGERVTEYWGTTDDGRDWRVHAHGHEMYA